MNKKIPVYFDTIVLDSPIQEISISNDSDKVSRLRVGVFYKYKNRNHSYITDEYAEKLIASAIKGDTPVVGFFDPESKEWASHTGPALANGYGYIENFLGWEPLQDTDGITRDYAIFSVVLFTKYYEEANKIIGQHQSMELDPLTIAGQWVEFDGEDYYVYTEGEMRGLCVIGSHEPCFSVSSFFEKEENYKPQYKEYSSLLFDLKAQVEEAEKSKKGGEQKMEDFGNVQVQEPEAEQNIQSEPEVVANEFGENEASTSQSVAEENLAEKEDNTSNESQEDSQFELLQQQFTELESKYNESINSFEVLKTENENLKKENNELKEAISKYKEKEAAFELAKKEQLIDEYKKVLSEEEIGEINEKVNDFSYDELEAKLAVIYSKKNLKNFSKELKIPLVAEQEESAFASLMKHYKKK